MSARTRRSGLAALACVGAILASGCTFHPGQAAVVNGSNISQSSVDDLVQAGCVLSKLFRQQGGGQAPDTSTASLRGFFTENLILFKVVDKAAAEMHLTVSPATIAKLTERQHLPAGLSSSERSLLSTFFTESARYELQRAVIGAHLKDPSVTNADAVGQSDVAASREFVTQYTIKQDITVNPAMGTWSKGQLIDTDGSLSAAQSAPARRWLSLRADNTQSVAGLPPNQVCG